MRILFYRINRVSFLSNHRSIDDFIQNDGEFLLEY